LANFRVLLPALHDDLLQQLSSDHTFAHSINWSLPQFQVYRRPGDTALNDALNTLDAPPLPLHSVINKSLQNEVLNMYIKIQNGEINTRGLI